MSDQLPLNTGTPPSDDPVLAEMRLANARMFELISRQGQQIEGLTQQVQGAVRTVQTPQEAPVTAEEFHADPVTHLERRDQKILAAISQQLAPVNYNIQQQQKQQNIEAWISNNINNPFYSDLAVPAVKQAFVASLMAANGNIEIGTINFAYFAAVGSAKANGQLNANTVIPQPKIDETVPAHLRSTPARRDNTPSISSLPALDANEAKLASERGWSQARACYMYGKIDEATYIKLEPTGKLKRSVFG
jgi:hypothetical protein